MVVRQINVITGTVTNRDQTASEIKAIEDYAKLPKVKRDTGTFREFMELFTDAEKSAIIELTQTSVDIKLWYDQALAGDVFLGHAKVDAGLSALVSLTIITAERKAAIIASDFDA
ncbi:hypothetical protein [Lentilitoribacter sp. Alg239-R112]|uniref:hypothetical protein n=1 Tax=Lentilitoribacter sp. Alg239-R112 TaxID=2305987 RepID=UPI0013A6E412|nr:hypothetical protein [Lentilitoribacter sp. Alg239-R112]